MTNGAEIYEMRKAAEQHRIAAAVLDYRAEGMVAAAHTVMANEKRDAARYRALEAEATEGFDLAEYADNLIARDKAQRTGQ